MFVSCPNVDGFFDQKPGAPGRFEFKGLPDGPVDVHIAKMGRRDRRYELSTKNLCRDPSLGSLEGQLDRDITDLTILLDPIAKPDLTGVFPRHSDVDPAVEADFEDARAGPITGVPPQP